MHYRSGGEAVLFTNYYLSTHFSQSAHYTYFSSACIYIYIYLPPLLHQQKRSLNTGAGRKIHAGTRHYAVLPLSFAVKPLKCAESARHDLLPCPDCQNLSKWGGGKSMSNRQQTTIFIFIFSFTCMMLSVPSKFACKS